jgi:L-ascorbate metabolism protein UlaG (beta-lactamase superfamily)
MYISKLGHACLYIEEGEARILIDPGVYSTGYEVLEGVTAVLVTHQHPDHATPETLGKIRDHNPDVAIYADEGTVQVMNEAGFDGVQAVHAGEEFEVAGVNIKVQGSRHAVIHTSMPPIENVGYMVAKRFFYPGDNFYLPIGPVEILGLPLGAPWLKISEVIDYVTAVRPEIAVPVHDAVLAMPEMNIGILKGFTDADGIRILVIPNGSRADFGAS